MHPNVGIGPLDQFISWPSICEGQTFSNAVRDPAQGAGRAGTEEKGLQCRDTCAMRDASLYNLPN